MGRPTKGEAAAWTQQLLDAARTLFCERGFAGASLDALAVRLRCSKHSIYRRFDDKLALFAAVVERDVARFVAALDASGQAAGSPPESLRAMARRYFDFGASREYAAFYAVLSLESATSAPLRAMAAGWADLALAPLRAAIAEALAPADPEAACALLVDLLDGAANRVRLEEGAPADRDAAFLARWEIFTRVVPGPA